MADSVHSKGATLSIDISTVMTAIPGVTGLSVPPRTPDPIDDTDLDSVAKEFILDIPDGGEISFTLNAKKKSSGNGLHASQAALETNYEAGTSDSFEIELPATISTTYAFTAFVTEFRPQPAVGSQIKIAVTLKVTGAVTRTVAA